MPGPVVYRLLDRPGRTLRRQDLPVDGHGIGPRPELLRPRHPDPDAQRFAQHGRRLPDHPEPAHRKRLRSACRRRLRAHRGHHPCRALHHHHHPGRHPRRLRRPGIWASVIQSQLRRGEPLAGLRRPAPGPDPQPDRGAVEFPCPRGRLQLHGDRHGPRLRHHGHRQLHRARRRRHPDQHGPATAVPGDVPGPRSAAERHGRYPTLYLVPGGRRAAARHRARQPQRPDLGDAD